MSDAPRRSQEVKLRFPVMDSGVELPSLTMRRPKVKDQLIAEAATGVNPAQREVNLYANLCEVAPATISDLDMADYVSLQKVYESFLKPQE